MNRDIILEYREAFDHWLETGTVLEWTEVTKQFNVQYTPQWGTTSKYLLNDEYRDLRVAQANGEIIESRVKGPNTLLVYDETIEWNSKYPVNFDIPLEFYRVKPRPIFKIGDWVIPRKNCRTSWTIFQVDKIRGNNELVAANGTYIHATLADLWTPTCDELVVHWDNWRSNTRYLVAPYSTLMATWDNIAPLEYLKGLNCKQ